MRAFVPFLLLLGFGACGEDVSGGERDAAIPHDARFLSDAAHQICSPESDSCEEQRFQSICDFDRARCVECLTSVDCALPASLGPTCEVSQGNCQCSRDEDCAGNENGAYCHPIVKACGCIDADTCEGAQECQLEPYLGTGIRTCQLAPPVPPNQ